MSAADRWATADHSPGRINPGEAAQLANATRAGGVTRASSRAVLALLLRHTRGSFAIERSTRWIAEQIGSSHRTAIRAIDDLISTGLVVVVVAGTGRVRSSYRVEVELVRAMAATATNKVDSQATEGCQTVTPDVTVCHPRGDSLSPPSARARASLPLSFLSPLPPAPDLASKTDPSPAASRGDPLRWQSQPEAKCVHGRTRAQGGCRLCQTTRRDDTKVAKNARVKAEAQQAVKHLAEQRAAEAQHRAASVPPPADWRHR